MKRVLEILRNAQNGNIGAKEELYKKFLPYIRYYGNKLYYEEAQTDLTIFLLEFIDNMDLRKFENKQDGEIINYMKGFFKSRYIDAVRKNINKHIEITAFETEFICYDCYEGLEEETALYKLSDAIILFGIGVVVNIACTHMGKDIKTTAGVVSSILGGVWAAAEVLSAATEALLENGLQKKINNLGDGETLKVTTKFYEY